MEVTVLGGADVGLAQPSRLTEVCHRMADSREMEDHVDFRPKVTVATGVQSFVDWYRRYYGV